MPTHKHHAHKKPTDLAHLSIFNNITVTTPVTQEHKDSNDVKKEDGCTNCFTALLRCLKR